MNYLSTDKNEKGIDMPRGEVCIRSPSTFVGYYKNEEVSLGKDILIKNKIILDYY